MTRRYETRPAGWALPDDAALVSPYYPASMDIMEREKRARDTGLLDRAGARLFAVDEVYPIGFVHYPPLKSQRPSD